MAITISAAILDWCLRKTRADKSPDYRDVIVFEKLRFQMFPVHTKTQSSVFKSFFEKLRFRWTISPISVDGRPNRRNKAPFSNSSGVVWTGPKFRNIVFVVGTRAGVLSF